LALYQRHTEIIFEFFQLCGECRLADEAALSGFAEVPGIRHGDEVTQIFEFDVSHPGSPSERFTASIEIITSIEWPVEDIATKLLDA
jgi:hypothetical protein